MNNKSRYSLDVFKVVGYIAWFHNSSNVSSQIPALVDIRPSSSMPSVFSDDIGLCSDSLVALPSRAWLLV